MKTGKRSGLHICAGLLTLVLLSGCGGSNSNTTIPTVATVFYSHAAFLNHSTLKTVGYNGFGQLGDGTLDTRASAVVPALNKMNGFAVGQDFTIAFKNNSSVMAWGYNAYGQLGNSTIPTNATSTTACYSSTPVRVGTLSGVTSVAAGNRHALAVLSDGTVYGWGDNSYGQLGKGTDGQVTTPQQVWLGDVGVPLPPTKQVAAGAYHSLALTTDGRVFAWGDNTYGQMAETPVATTTNPAAPYSVDPHEVLADVTPTNPAVMVAAAGSYSLALMTDGTVYAWGVNGSGQLGPLAIAANLGTANANPTPVLVQIPDPNKAGKFLHIDKISAGLAHVLALVGDAVWGWGLDSSSQLGDNPATSNATRSTPVRAKDSTGAPMTGALDIQAFGTSSLVKIRNVGTGLIELWGFGENNFGQLGAPIVTTGISYLAVPRKVDGF